ncbi:MAG: hypothetical protein EZS28_034415 [Streblomastix strix]|uniref:Uncharacterized protein n=1 Tax=Streblomastix strix TaxID=222440 RepID=A0A5J4UHP1_9EUKA|nr:MAG: hypothetical protein EZS28_034415 [Streblomastix strix]
MNQALCLSILLNFNSKSGLAVNESHIQTLYASLIQTVQSADEAISESANIQLIQAMKKLPEFKQFLVQRSGFLKKTTEILLQENSSSSSSSQQIISNDHVKSAFLDIIIQLALQKNLKWNQIELIELINILEVIAGSEEGQQEEDSLEAKAQQLLPLLKMKISKQGKESKQQNCDECQKLGEELHQKEDKLIRNEEQKRTIEEESRRKDDIIRQKDILIQRIEDEFPKNKSNVRNAKRIDVENVHLRANIAKSRIARIVHGSVKNVINLIVNNVPKKGQNVMNVRNGYAENAKNNVKLVLRNAVLIV